MVTRSGTSVDLAPNLEGLPAAAPTFTPSHMVGQGRRVSCICLHDKGASGTNQL